ncbi:MAG: FecR domain-containing protein [Flavobacteriaceae bacterium]|nr:FecR domain-containing protein [Flavobacteriaceae bacterium]
MKHNETHSSTSYLALWLAGDLTDNQLQTLVSEADFIAYKKLRQGIACFDVLEAPLDKTLNEIHKTIKPKRLVQKRSKYWALAIAASIVLCLGIFTFFDSNNVMSRTGIGQHETLALIDGSEVHLNAQSTLSYDTSNWEDTRTLSLNGEAYFKVTKGQTFTVNTRNGAVTVLGTQFNVISHENYFEVTCYEGKVRVTSNTNEVSILTAGKRLRITNNTIETDTLKESLPTWINGESSFKSIPLKHVIEAIESQYHIQIDATEIDTNTIFTGSFSHHNLNLALKTIFDPLNIKYTNEKEQIIKLSAN